MVVDDIIINDSVENILNLLKLDLLNKNIELFESIKPNMNNIQTNCPFHKDGHERKPSFGINIENGLCNCFTCGWRGTITRMISQVYGYDDYGEFGKKWLIKNFNSTEIEHRSGIKLPSREKFIKTISIVDENELDSYRYYHPYMYERGLTNEIIEKFDIGYDKNTQCITFPVKDLQGNVIFVARRSVNTKYFNYPTNVNKPVYGAYLFKDGKYKECYITESFFNCLTLWKFGLPAVALMGTGSRDQIDILKQLPVRQYILALDPDDAGRKSTHKLRVALQDTQLIKEILYTDSNKDINDLQEDFLLLHTIM